jgi:hypothetical protein
VILYHWTSTHHLESILADGQITGTDNQLVTPSKAEAKMGAVQAATGGRRRGPDVVWLTDQATPERLTGVLGVIHVLRDGREVYLLPRHAPPEYNKTRVRLDVEVTPDEHEAAWWPRWARRQGIKERWYAELAAVGKAHGGHPHDWFVLEAPISLNRVLGVYVDRELQAAGVQ